ncbi:MAG: methyl-accepting chemotaxis protein [Sulfitobacter sp.]
MKNVKIGTKLPLIMVGLVAVTIVVLTLANAFLTERIVTQAAEVKLKGLSVLKAKRVEFLIETIDRNIRLRAASPATTQALIALADGYESLEDPLETLTRVYVTENEYPIGEKDKLVSADTGSSYGFIHAIYHPTFDQLQNEMHYYDIFLIDPEGNIVYSVFKENDFATNLNTGEWSDSNLAHAFRSALEMGADDPTTFVDFAPYGPSADAPAAFMSRPVFNEKGTLLGVLAVQMPVDLINIAARDLVGLGETADGFLVGSDGLLRTDSLFSEENDILTTSANIPELQAAALGESLFFEADSFSGQHVLGYITPIELNGVRWTVVLQQSKAELLEGLRWAISRTALISAVVFGLALVISIYFARGIARPVQVLAGAVKEVANGDLTTTVPAQDRLDEIGEVARAAEVFRQNAEKMEELNKEQAAAQEKMQKMNAEREKAAQKAVKIAAEQEEKDRAAAQAQRDMMRDLGNSFGEVVSAAVAGQFSKRVDADFDDDHLIGLAQNINMLMEAVESGLSQTGKLLERVAAGDLTQRMDGNFQGAFADLQTNVNAMISSLTTLVGDIANSGTALSGSADGLRESASELSRQAEQNAASIEETSAALEELAANIKNVDLNIEEVSNTAEKASASARASETIAEDAARSMDRIATGSTEISRVTEVINEIAFQINLLALNAGVEAARAGEAGRGFSVVASEVRQLSQRASEAAREIEDVIKESDTAVDEGVKKVADARSSLEEIAKSVIQISSRVAEVKTATSEQSAGIAEINSAVVQIDSNTQQQAAAFEKLTGSSNVLSDQARELETTTARFVTEANGERSHENAARRAG